MVAKVAPIQGDPIPDGLPSVEKWVKVTYGATHGNVQFDTDNEVTTLFTLPQYGYYTEVGTRVATVFNAGVDLVLGDTDDPNGWSEVADLDATAADSSIMWAGRWPIGAANSDISTSPAYAGVGVGADTGSRLIQITHANTTPSAGLVEVYIRYVMAPAQESTLV